MSKSKERSEIGAVKNSTITLLAISAGILTTNEIIYPMMELYKALSFVNVCKDVT